MSQYKKIIPLGEATVVTAGSRVQFISTDTPTSWIFVQAKITNTSPIYVGDAAVTSSHYFIALQPGQGMAIEASEVRGITGEFDVADFYADAGTNGQVFSVTYEASRV